MRFIPEIRHPEEMSLSRRLDSRELKKNQGVSATRRPARPGYNSPNHHHHLSSNSLVYDPSTGHTGILDLGLASSFSELESARKSAPAPMGNLNYISPELTFRVDITADHRADL